MLTCGRAVVFAVHQDWVHILTAEFTPQYLSYLVDGEVGPDFEGLCVNCSRGYRLATKDRIQAAVSVVAMLNYVDTAVMEAN
jgi:ribosomal protein S27AE